MNIKQIFSLRYNSGQNYALPIIYEWEDEISRELNESGYKTANGKQWQIVQVQRLIKLYES